MSRPLSLRPAAMALLLGLLLSTGAWATSYRELSLSEMLERTQIAFLGTVSSLRVEERQGEPWTVVEFEVDRAVDGVSGDGGRLELEFLGGELPGEALRVNLMPGFEVGEQVLLFAYDEEYISPVVGFNQGLWRRGDDGLLDDRGRRLGLDDEGRLTIAGVETDLDLILDAVERELEARQ